MGYHNRKISLMILDSIDGHQNAYLREACKVDSCVALYNIAVQPKGTIRLQPHTQQTLLAGSQPFLPRADCFAHVVVAS